MKRSRHITATLLFILLTTLLPGRKVEAQGLVVDFDFATFRYDTSNTYMEFYYSFNMKSLKMLKADSVFADSVVFQIRLLRNGKGTEGYSQAWVAPVQVNDTASGGLNKTLVGQIGLAILPGDYSMYVAAIDRNDTSNIDSVSQHVKIPKYSYAKLETSDIELCSQITQADQNERGIFYKNTYNVIPNPKDIYGAGLPILYYYIEVYNIPDAPGDSVLTEEYVIRDSFGQVRKSRESLRKKFSDTSVEVGTINCSDLRTGTYTLIYTVIDSAENKYASSSRRLFIYNPGLGSPETAGSNLAGMSVLSSVFATMDDEQITREFREARYIATPTEIEQFDELQSLPAKRQFLYDFWLKRSPNPALNSNPFRAEYIQRVAYANDHYRVGSREGWQTDRGRVYVLYGAPDQIDRHPNEGSSKPYEIWYYNSIQGGVSFDFVDKTGFGDYMLVNSTARTEIHDDNWQQYLSGR